MCREGVSYLPVVPFGSTSENPALQLTSLCLMSSGGLLLADCRGEEVSVLSFLLSPLLLLLEEGGAVTLGGGDGTVGGSSPVR